MYYLIQTVDLLILIYHLLLIVKILKIYFNYRFISIYNMFYRDLYILLNLMNYLNVNLIFYYFNHLIYCYLLIIYMLKFHTFLY